MYIVKLMNFFKASFLVFKLTSHSIRAVKIRVIVKLHAVSRLVFIVQRCYHHIDLMLAVSELALVAVATEVTFRLNPVLAQLSLVLCLITLRIVNDNRLTL